MLGVKSPKISYFADNEQVKQKMSLLTLSKIVLFINKRYTLGTVKGDKISDLQKNRFFFEIYLRICT